MNAKLRVRSHSTEDMPCSYPSAYWYQCEFALHHAVQRGDYETVQKLMDRDGKSALQPDEAGMLPARYLLDCACVYATKCATASSVQKIAKLLFRQTGASIAICTTCQSHLLFAAIRMNSIDMVALILNDYNASGANHLLNAFDRHCRCTLLEYAVICCRDAILPLLVRGATNGVNLALDRAQLLGESQRCRVVARCIEAGASLDFRKHITEDLVGYHVDTFCLYYLSGLRIDRSEAPLRDRYYKHDRRVVTDIEARLIPRMINVADDNTDPQCASLTDMCRRLTYPWSTEACIALQGLRLPALVLVEILAARYCAWPRIPMHHHWRLVTLIKHWHRK